MAPLSPKNQRDKFLDAKRYNKMIYYLYFPLYPSMESGIMYVLLLLSVAFLWVPRLRSASLPLYAAALFFGYLDDRITPQALISISILGICCYLKGHLKLGKVSETIVNLAILIIGFDMVLHIMPGFHNWKMLSNYHISPMSRPYNLYLNVDKITLGLFIIGGMLPLCQKRKEWQEALITGIGIAAIAAIILLVPSMLVGYVAWDPKLPWMFFFWAATNLLFVCVSEEAFFRGFLQTELSKYFDSQKAILIAALLFGLAHYPGGPIYIILSAVAGLFYGYSYFLTEKIESSILTHFTVNLLHFTLFTYPSSL